MLQLSNLLARFKGISNTEKAKKEMVGHELTRIIGVPITYQQVVFSKNTLILKVQPIIKSEIVLKKDEILQKIKTIMGLEHITTIQ